MRLFQRSLASGYLRSALPSPFLPFRLIFSQSSLSTLSRPPSPRGCEFRNARTIPGGRPPVHGYSPEFLRLLSSMFAERDGLEGAASSTGSSRRRVATLISVGNFALSRRIQPRPPLITRLPPLRVGSSDGTDIRPPAIFTHPLGRTFLNRSTVN